MAAKVLSRVHEEPPPLSLLERELVCAVLEDTVHQLAVLGGIMPDYSTSAAAVEHVRNAQLTRLGPKDAD